MDLMEITPNPSEQPKKIIKVEAPLDLSIKNEKWLTPSPQPNIVQRKKYAMAANNSRQATKELYTYYQFTDNLIVFNLGNGEILVVNAPLNEICDWQPTPIPYLCLPVKSYAEQQTVVNRAGIVLASFYQLSHCTIGIKIDVTKCQEPGSQFQDITNLRRAIWRFLAEEITYMPPHLRQFFKAELKLILSTTQPSKISQPPATNSFKLPGCLTSKVKNNLIYSLRFFF